MARGGAEGGEGWPKGRSAARVAREASRGPRALVVSSKLFSGALVTFFVLLKSKEIEFPTYEKESSLRLASRVHHTQ
jgi:hypothetical protein